MIFALFANTYAYRRIKNGGILRAAKVVFAPQKFVLTSPVKELFLPLKKIVLPNLQQQNSP